METEGNNLNQAQRRPRGENSQENKQDEAVNPA
jgi:hypothetical protein